MSTVMRSQVPVRSGPLPSSVESLPQAAINSAAASMPHVRFVMPPPENLRMNRLEP
jgi:hypothetical protein